MPHYVYSNRRGDSFEVFLPMSKAPPVGHKMRRGGRVYRRQAGVGELVAVKQIGQSWIGGRALPKVKNMSPEEQQAVDAVDPDGFALFNSAKSAKRWTDIGRRRAEKNGGNGDFYKFDTNGPPLEAVHAAIEKRKPLRE